MRSLLAMVPPTVWQQYSAITFLLIFLVIIVMVYRPATKKRYEEFARSVIDEDVTENKRGNGKEN